MVVLELAALNESLLHDLECAQSEQDLAQVKLLFETGGATVVGSHETFFVAALADATSEDAEPVRGAYLSEAELDELRVVDAVLRAHMLAIDSRLMGPLLPLAQLGVF